MGMNQPNIWHSEYKSYIQIYDTIKIIAKMFEEKSMISLASCKFWHLFSTYDTYKNIIKNLNLFGKCPPSLFF